MRNPAPMMWVGGLPLLTTTEKDILLSHDSCSRMNGNENGPLRVFVDMRTVNDFIYMEWAKDIACLMEKHYPCERCSDCCHQEYLVIRDNEWRSIAAFLKMKPIEFRRRYLKRDRGCWYLRNSDPCDFLNLNDHSCSIYAYRPEICRVFPYQTPWFLKVLFDVLKNGLENCPPGILYMGEDCPCRKDIGSRTRAAVLEFLSDEDAIEVASKRGVERFAEVEAEDEGRKRGWQ